MEFDSGIRLETLNKVDINDAMVWRAELTQAKLHEESHNAQVPKGRGHLGVFSFRGLERKIR